MALQSVWDVFTLDVGTLSTRFPVWQIMIGAFLAYVVATAVAGLIGRTNFPLPGGERRAGCIDGLRGYLAVSVVIHHFIIWIQDTRLGAGWQAPSVHLFNQLGAGAVALFFMTTGFVFYPRILTGFQNCSWPAIYLTRVFRIVPLVGVSIALITIVIALRTGHRPDASFPRAAMKWLVAYSEPSLLGYEDSGRLNAYVLWSLWYEWVFYVVVFPACALAMDLVRGRAPSWFVPVGVLAGSLAGRALHVPGSMVTYLPLFAMGMIAFECHRNASVVHFLQLRSMTVAAGAALALGMIAFETPYFGGLPLFGFFFVSVSCGNTMGGLFRTRAALVLGECSFSIYLLHGLLLSIVFVDANSLISILTASQLVLLLPVVVGAAALLASVTFTTCERPAFQFGGQLARMWINRDALLAEARARRPAFQSRGRATPSLVGRALHVPSRELGIAS